ncbi:MAG TPA: VTT domain-containing protein [Opitutaceae bacterium]|nr:VTT domain-containing protein [Opitutaceae bacterium]
MSSSVPSSQPLPPGGIGHSASPSGKIGGRSRPSGRRKRRETWAGWWWLALALLAIAGGVALVFSHIDFAAINRTIDGFNSGVVILLMAVLPLFGFPISVVYLMAGARFGPLEGFAVVVLVTALHLLATYWITRSFLRAPLERLLERRGHRLPHIQAGEHAGVCVLAALVPGPPYFARNYLLALTDVPLRTYFWVCLTVYAIRSYMTILLGDFATDPDRSQIAFLVGVYVVKLAVCAWVVWRLRRRTGGWKTGGREPLSKGRV